MRGLTGSLLLISFLMTAVPAAANHPGEELDRVMEDKEPYFQAIGRPAPGFELADPQGRLVSLSDYTDKVVVLHFIYASCPDICPLHAEKIAEAQALVNDSPMREMVQFLSITTDPSNDTAEIREAFGSVHGLDTANWRFLSTIHPALEGKTRQLAEAYGHRFNRTPDGQQIHGTVTHVIGPNAHWAANFHGLEFKSLNFVLYVNGLIDNSNSQSLGKETSWWSRFVKIFEDGEG